MSRRLAALWVVFLVTTSCAHHVPRGDGHPLRGQLVHLPDVARGGVEAPALECSDRSTLLVFWSPHCAPCKPYLGLLDRLALRAGPAGPRLLGVATWGTHAEVAQVLAEHRITFPQLEDPTGEWLAAYQLERVPVVLAVDRCRRLIYVSPAGAALDELESVFWAAESLRP